MHILPLVHDYYQVIYIPYRESEIKESPPVVGAHMLGQTLMAIAGSGGTVLSITGINKQGRGFSGRFGLAPEAGSLLD